VMNIQPIKSTGKAKISRLLLPLFVVPAATNEDISQSFMKSWRAHPRIGPDTQEHRHKSEHQRESR
jgi:hypothetical protein